MTVDERQEIFEQQYSEKIDLYEAYAKSLVNYLNDLFRVNEINYAFVDYRLKSRKSLERKFSNKKKDNETYKYDFVFSNVQCSVSETYCKPSANSIFDVIGIRIFTVLPHKEYEINRIIRGGVGMAKSDLRPYRVHEIKDKYPLVLGESGYSSLHMIVHHHDSKNEILGKTFPSGISAEIQIRTFFSHSWAELEHLLRYEHVREGHSYPPGLSTRLEQMAGVLATTEQSVAILVDDHELWTSLMGNTSEKKPITSSTLLTFLSYYFPAKLTQRSTTENILQMMVKILYHADIKTYYDLHLHLNALTIQNVLKYHRDNLEFSPAILRTLDDVLLFESQEGFIAKTKDVYNYREESLTQRLIDMRAAIAIS